MAFAYFLVAVLAIIACKSVIDMVTEIINCIRLTKIYAQALEKIKEINTELPSVDQVELLIKYVEKMKEAK